MSRIGKKPVVIPNGVTVEASGSTLVVKGPKGELRKTLSPEVQVAVSDNTAEVTPSNQGRQALALWGTFAAHLNNMVAGVTEGYTKRLVIEGVGYRAETQGNNLVMQLGYSHPVTMAIPAGLEVSVEKNTITITGIDKEAVGQFAANVRDQRKPEPYKGKGIRYEDEVVRRKEGKKSA